MGSIDRNREKVLSTGTIGPFERGRPQIQRRKSHTVVQHVLNQYIYRRQSPFAKIFLTRATWKFNNIICKWQISLNLDILICNRHILVLSFIGLFLLLKATREHNTSWGQETRREMCLFDLQTLIKMTFGSRLALLFSAIVNWNVFITI